MIQVRQQFGNLYVRILDTMSTFDYTLEKIRSIPNRSFKANTGEWMFPKSSISDIMVHFENQIVWLQPLEEIVKDVSIQSDIVKKHLDWQNNDDFKDFTLKPYGYQKVGAHFLADRGRTAVFDGVGLGKTIQILGACQILMNQGKAKRALVVTLNSIKRQWAKEVEKFTPHQALAITGSSAQRLKKIKQFKEDTSYTFMVINYETLRSPKQKEAIIDIGFDVIALDEAQKIKSGVKDTKIGLKPSQNAAACFEVREKIPYRFIATATPVQGKPQEIYSLMSFLDEGIFGSWDQFRERYCKYHPKWGITGAQNEGELHMRISPHFIRRTKEMPEIQQQLPKVKHDHIFLEMTDTQEKLQEHILDKMAELKEERRTVGPSGKVISGQMLSQEQAEEHYDGMIQACRTFLIELCDSPSILVHPEASGMSHSIVKELGISYKEANKSPKAEHLVDFYKQLQYDEPSAKIVIFTRYTRMAERIANELRQASEYPQQVMLYHGKLSDQDKEIAKERFVSDPNVKVLVGTDAISTGANLQVASYMIHVDFPDSHTDVSQRNGRIDRTGNPNPNITIQYLVMSDGYDEQMLDLLDKKSDMSDAILEGGKMRPRSQDFTKLAVERMIKNKSKPKKVV